MKIISLGEVESKVKIFMCFTALLIMLVSCTPATSTSHNATNLETLNKKLQNLQAPFENENDVFSLLQQPTININLFAGRQIYKLSNWESIGFYKKDATDPDWTLGLCNDRVSSVTLFNSETTSQFETTKAVNFNTSKESLIQNMGTPYDSFRAYSRVLAYRNKSLVVYIYSLSVNKVINFVYNTEDLSKPISIIFIDRQYCPLSLEEWLR